MHITYIIFFCCYDCDYQYLITDGNTIFLLVLLLLLLLLLLNKMLDLLFSRTNQPHRGVWRGGQSDEVDSGGGFMCSLLYSLNKVRSTLTYFSISLTRSHTHTQMHNLTMSPAECSTGRHLKLKCILNWSFPINYSTLY